jgi:hypothetical protein
MPRFIHLICAVLDKCYKVSVINESNGAWNVVITCFVAKEQIPTRIIQYTHLEVLHVCAIQAVQVS